MKRPVVIFGKEQNYPWGTSSFIPDLLNLSSPEEIPFAEYWLGTHPRGPAHTSDDISLLDVINEDPGYWYESYPGFSEQDGLPFLLKVLSAETPLSIQAHPEKAQAVKGFEREEMEGIPIDAPHRNYRDKNHKPEIICALTPFTALKGFREWNVIDSFLKEIEENLPFIKRVDWSYLSEEKALKALVKTLLTLDSDQASILEKAVLNWAENNEEYRESFWIKKIAGIYPCDPGILAPLYLNLVELKPGEALYLQAGEFHAYLEGSGIELMASSDNVLRGGLTQKHKDLQELLNVLDFHSHVLKKTGKIPFTGRSLYLYNTPCSDFLLVSGSVREGVISHFPEKHPLTLFIMVEGECLLQQKGSDSIVVKRGTSLCIPADSGGFTLSGEGQFFAATLPELQ